MLKKRKKGKEEERSRGERRALSSRGWGLLDHLMQLAFLFIVVTCGPELARCTDAASASARADIERSDEASRQCHGG